MKNEEIRKTMQTKRRNQIPRSFLLIAHSQDFIKQIKLFIKINE